MRWVLVVAVVLSTLCQSAADDATDDGVDVRRDFPPERAVVKGRAVPSLAGHPQTGMVGPPVPGGLGAGVIYAPGALPVLSRAELYTGMIVYPEGIAVPNWLFTTATNRTEKTAEVVGIYIGTGASLGVFDWSCTADDPCPNGEVGASWQWTRDLNELGCYYASGDDGGGHARNLLYYRNRSRRHGTRWTNSVLLRNQCAGHWDLVYLHDFRGEQRDCSIDNQCGWWGPILETFNDDPQPTIKELGFLDTRLRHDNEWSALAPDETGFVYPPPQWPLQHIVPNGSWTAGNIE